MASLVTLLLLALSGVVTVGPLLLFGMGAQASAAVHHRASCNTSPPTMLFVEGAFWFGEPLIPGGWRRS